MNYHFFENMPRVESFSGSETHSSRSNTPTETDTSSQSSTASGYIANLFLVNSPLDPSWILCKTQFNQSNDAYLVLNHDRLYFYQNTNQFNLPLSNLKDVFADIAPGWFKQATVKQIQILVNGSELLKNYLKITPEMDDSDSIFSMSL